MSYQVQTRILKDSLLRSHHTIPNLVGRPKTQQMFEKVFSL